MGKRALPPGLKCVPLLISARPQDVARWRRRAAEERVRGNRQGASVSGAIRIDAEASSRFRHSARSPLNAIMLALEAHKHAAIDTPDLIAMIRRHVRRLLELVSEV